MTSDNNPRPYHAKGKPSGQEAADAVAAVLQHAHARDEAASVKAKTKKQPKWMLPLGINLCVFAVYLLIAPPDWVEFDPFEEMPQEAQVENMGTAMWLQANRVDAYQIENGGRLPASLADAGSPVPGIEYAVLGANQYTLTAQIGDETVVYDSSQPETKNALMSQDAILKIQAGG